jgi:hypothetical protein
LKEQIRWKVSKHQRTFDLPGAMPDFWALTDRQLERACRMMAEGRVPMSLPLLRGEAMRLFLLWREYTPAKIEETRSEGEQRACLLAALRKRTIQVLVRIALRSRPVIQTAPD